MLSLSKITSLGKDTITLEVSVDDWLGMQITEKEYHTLGGLDNTSPINNLKFTVLLKQILLTFKLHIYAGSKTSVTHDNFYNIHRKKPP